MEECEALCPRIAIIELINVLRLCLLLRNDKHCLLTLLA